jgi:hypothetical protein
VNAVNVSDIALAIVGVATITALFGNPNSASVINSIGAAFSNAIRASLGKA